MGNAFKSFQAGQRVSVKELETGYLLDVVAGAEPGLDVVEVGRDYLVIEDQSAGVQTRIPRHLILSSAPAVVPAPLAQSA
jgi:hypothetical protein